MRTILLSVVSTSRSYRLHVSSSRVAAGLAPRRKRKPGFQCPIAGPPSAGLSDFSPLYISLSIKSLALNVQKAATEV